MVGYLGKNSGDQNNFIAVPFASVGYNTSDIQMIEISDDGAGQIGWGGETFDIWEGAPAIVEGTSFLYTDPSMDPTQKATSYYWGDAEGKRAIFSVVPGQGGVLGLSEGLVVTYAGEVATDDVSFTAIQGNNFTGNSFATAIDIQSIKISDEGAGKIGWGGETFDIWEGAPTVSVGSSFLYMDPSMDPSMKATSYYWGDADGNPVSYSISAGQGFVLGLAEGLSVTIESPISK